MEKSTKRERVTFNGSRRKLQGVELKQDKNHWVLRWVNDDGERLADMQARGYLFVSPDEITGSVGDREIHGGSSDLNNKVSRIVIKDRANPVRGFLMKISKEFYLEDKKEKELENQKVDEAVRAGKSGGASVANQYGDVAMTSRRQ